MRKYSGLGLSGAPEVEALAEVWASLDGKLKEFQEEKLIEKGGFANSTVIAGGYRAGYLCEAEEAINRLRDRGFDVLPIRPTNIIKIY